jgi:hypothetical protein
MGSMLGHFGNVQVTPEKTKTFLVTLQSVPASAKQGCQMVRYQTKNHNLGKIWRVLQRKTLVYFVAIW